MEDRVQLSTASASTTHHAPVVDRVADITQARIDYNADRAQPLRPVNVDPGPSIQATLGWETAIPGTTIQAQALDPANSLLVEAGYAGSDIAIVRLNVADGTGFDSQVFHQDGHVLKALAVDVDGAGTIYVAGTETTGSTTGYLARIRSDLSGMDWSLDTGLFLKGAKLDAAGTSLYVAGAGTGGMHTMDLLYEKLTDLGNSLPTVVYNNVRSSDAGPSYGNAITVNSEGRADFAASVESISDGNDYFSPGFFQVLPGGGWIPGWLFPDFDGGFNAVALDPADESWILVGTALDTTGDSTVTGLIDVKAASDISGNLGDFVWPDLYFLITWQDNQGHDVTSTANGVAVDAHGFFYYTGTIESNSPTGRDALVVKIDGHDGQTVTDHVLVDNNQQNDEGVAIALFVDSQGMLHAFVAATSNGDSFVFELTNFS